MSQFNTLILGENGKVFNYERKLTTLKLKHTPSLPKKRACRLGNGKCFLFQSVLFFFICRRHCQVPDPSWQRSGPMGD